ncbi:hypothetical protein VDGL01_11410 [Verticillium dahliae]
MVSPPSPIVRYGIILHAPRESIALLEEGTALIHKARKPRQDGLAPIVGWDGAVPFDYLAFFKRFTAQVNLMEIMQISPDTIKHLRRYATRKGATSKTHAMSGSLETEGPPPGFQRPTGPDVTPRLHTATRPYRVDCIVTAKVGGKMIRFPMPPNSTQADQGSEVNMISPAIINFYQIPKYSLSLVGLGGLHITTSDGNVTPMREFVVLKATVDGLQRDIWAIVRPAVVTKKGVVPSSNCTSSEICLQAGAKGRISIEVDIRPPRTRPEEDEVFAGGVYYQHFFGATTVMATRRWDWIVI